MGSGETAPTMVKVHRQLLQKMGPPPVPAVLLDTPFAFQENAREIAGRAVTYFRESLQAPIAVSTLAGEAQAGAGPDPFADERLVTTVRDSRYVFAGPGSPSYALRMWQGTVVPSLIVEKLLHGGCVVFASVAALTLGIVTVPVYEIYKCGEDPHWLEGLDVTAAAGLRAAIIPHYDNNEGGTHDTRYCYLGERRLSIMERELPEGAFVLGVDEHTACVLDLDEGTASIEGRGLVTVRSAGRSETFGSGQILTIERILETAATLSRVVRGASAVEPPAIGVRERVVRELPAHREEEASRAKRPPGRPVGSPARRRSSISFVGASRFATAVAARDMLLAVGTVLDLEHDVTEWSTDIPSGDELDRAHASLRSLILELGRLSVTGARDPRDVIGPFVDALLELRDAAWRDGRFQDADVVRDRLAENGIEVRDTAGASEWLMAGESNGGGEPGA